MSTLKCSCTHHPVYGVEVDIDCPLHGEAEEIVEQKQSYTVAELLAMPANALNAMAAELRGWYISHGQNWQTEADGKYVRCSVYNDSEGAVMPQSEWTPATDRNQSGELLQWAAKEKDAAFSISIEGDYRQVGLATPDPSSVFDIEQVVDGNDAHAETAAFCAAMLTLEGRLNG